jgi:hypothetical protein
MALVLLNETAAVACVCEEGMKRHD